MHCSSTGWRSTWDHPPLGFVLVPDIQTAADVQTHVVHIFTLQDGHTPVDAAKKSGHDELAFHIRVCCTLCLVKEDNVTDPGRSKVLLWLAATAMISSLSQIALKWWAEVGNVRVESAFTIFERAVLGLENARSKIVNILLFSIHTLSTMVRGKHHERTTWT